MEKIVVTHKGRVDLEPEMVGLDGGRLALLREHFSRLIDANKLQAASYLVARGGQIVMNESLGKLTNQEDSTDLLPLSPRRVYSITKMFTSVAIMQLIEQGKLFVHQEVSTIMPEFDNDLFRKISIWHLLTHTSGLMGDPGSNGEAYPLPWYDWWVGVSKSKAKSWEANDWLRIALSGRLMSKPGEVCTYCSSGFAVLGEIIARITGMPYEDYILKYIAIPLGMERTFFVVPEHLRKETCFVNRYEYGNIFEPQDRTGMPPLASNGLYSTTEDLWKLGEALLNNGTLNGTEILSRRSIATLVSNQLKDIPSNSWGMNVSDYPMALGLSLKDEDLCTPGTYSHEGHGHSGLYIDPHERLIFSYFVPNKEGYVPEAVNNPRAIVWSALL
jgi:CubicO group peptidase (beta-lactamase class C family)